MHSNVTTPKSSISSITVDTSVVALTGTALALTTTTSSALTFPATKSPGDTIRQDTATTGAATNLRKWMFPGYNAAFRAKKMERSKRGSRRSAKGFIMGVGPGSKGRRTRYGAYLGGGRRRKNDSEAGRLNEARRGFIWIIFEPSSFEDALPNRPPLPTMIIPSIPADRDVPLPLPRSSSYLDSDWYARYILDDMLPSVLDEIFNPKQTSAIPLNDKSTSDVHAPSTFTESSLNAVALLPNSYSNNYIIPSAVHCSNDFNYSIRENVDWSCVDSNNVGWSNVAANPYSVPWTTSAAAIPWTFNHNSRRPQHYDVSMSSSFNGPDTSSAHTFAHANHKAEQFSFTDIFQPHLPDPQLAINIMAPLPVMQSFSSSSHSPAFPGPNIDFLPSACASSFPQRGPFSSGASSSSAFDFVGSGNAGFRGYSGRMQVEGVNSPQYY